MGWERGDIGSATERPIKGDVKRQFLPSTGGRGYSCLIQPRCALSRSWSDPAHPNGFHAHDRDGAIVPETDKRDGLPSWQPWSYWRLVAYSFLGLSERA